MRKIETPIFQVEKPSKETTATTFSISGIQTHEKVAMAMHRVTTGIMYIPERQYSKYMHISGSTYKIATGMPSLMEIHK